MNKTRKKYNRYRTLKTICYLLGFPLLLLLVYFGSTSMIYNDAFTDTKYYGLIAVALMWVVVSILQVLFSMLSKSKNGRATFGMIITLIVVIGGAVAFDIYAEKEFTKIETANSSYGVTMKSYKYQINYYQTITSDKSDLTDAYLEEVERFCRVYNVGVKSKCYSDDLNIDGSIPAKDKETGAYYSPNGMYADGYVFSMDEAIDILITYQETQEYYANLDKDADEELSNAIATTRTSSAYLAYKQTAEYQAAYGTNGTAYDHMLTMDEVDNILSILGEGLSSITSNSLIMSIVNGVLPAISSYLSLINEDLSLSVIVEAINDTKIETLLSFVSIEDELMEVIYEALMPVLEYATKSTTTLQFDTLANFKTSFKNITIKNLLTELDYTKLTTVLEGFDLDITQYSSIFNYGLTTQFIEELVNEMSLTSNLFFYQSTTVKPVFDFLTDERLKTYAYAKYYATVHGANVGSVLIGDNLGAVTLSSSGYPSEYGFTLTELYQLRMDNSYIAKAYPLFAARRYMYAMGGLMVILIALYYHNARKQDEAFAQMTNGGRR